MESIWNRILRNRIPNAAAHLPCCFISTVQNTQGRDVPVVVQGEHRCRMGSDRYQSICQSGYLESGKGRADGRSENAVTVNRAIDDLTSEIAGHYDRIKNSLGFITAELVKNAVKGIGQKPLTLLALFREHNEEFKKRVGIDRIRETYESYQRSYKHLSAFVRERRVWKMSRCEVLTGCSMTILKFSCAPTAT